MFYNANESMAKKTKIVFLFGILIYEVCCKNIPENWTNKFLVGSAMRLLAVAKLTVSPALRVTVACKAPLTTASIVGVAVESEVMNADVPAGVELNLLLTTRTTLILF